LKDAVLALKELQFAVVGENVELFPFKTTTSPEFTLNDVPAVDDVMSVHSPSFNLYDIVATVVDVVDAFHTIVPPSTISKVRYLLSHPFGP